MSIEIRLVAAKGEGRWGRDGWIASLGLEDANQYM